MTETSDASSASRPTSREPAENDGVGVSTTSAVPFATTYTLYRVAEAPKHSTPITQVPILRLSQEPRFAPPRAPAADQRSVDRARQQSR